MEGPILRRRIPLAEPDLRGREAELLLACVRDNWVSSAGPQIGAFERHVADIAGRRHGVATVNGTAALHLALVGVGVKPGDLVALPDFTFAASANAVCHAGAEPYFVDVDLASWTLDPELLDQSLRHPPDDRRIAAVILVDAVGGIAHPDPIAEVCRRHCVPLIEDAAGAIGATWRDRPAGSFGDAACFSFNGNKTVTAGGGGMLVTDDGDLAQSLRHLSAQARPSNRYRHDRIGFNYRMTNLNAALGLAQVERLDEMVANKRAIAARYDAALGIDVRLRPMPRDPAGESSCWLYTVLAAAPEEADGLLVFLNERGIEARPFWESLAVQPPYAGFPRRLAGRSARLSGCVLALPSSSSLTENDQAFVIESLADWRRARALARPAA